jgi:hypothetical protein
VSRRGVFISCEGFMGGFRECIHVSQEVSPTGPCRAMIASRETASKIAACSRDREGLIRRSLPE